jgi:hypothetical protein
MQSGMRACVLALGMTFSLGLSTNVLAFRAGAPPGRNGSPASGGASCIGCHDPGGSGLVQILGVPDKYAPNQEIDLTVRIEDPVQAGAGFQLSVEDPLGNAVGELVITDAINTQFDGFWVTHTFTGVGNSVTNWAGLGNAAEYNVRWIAPDSHNGPITFWVAGNAINNDSTNSGDMVYLTSETVGPPVPAASVWGLLTLTLLMLTIGTVLSARRRLQTAVV